MIKVEFVFNSVQDAAKLFNTMSIMEQNTRAAEAEISSSPVINAGSAAVAPTPEEKPPVKRTRAKAPESAAAAAPTPAAEAITRDEALAFLRAIAEAKKISGPQLIEFLKKTFGVPKFSDIKPELYVQLKNIADETTAMDTVADPLA